MWVSGRYCFHGVVWPPNPVQLVGSEQNKSTKGSGMQLGTWKGSVVWSLNWYRYLQILKHLVKIGQTFDEEHIIHNSLLSPVFEHKICKLNSIKISCCPQDKQACQRNRQPSPGQPKEKDQRAWQKARARTNYMPTCIMCVLCLVKCCFWCACLCLFSLFFETFVDLNLALPWSFSEQPKRLLTYLTYYSILQEAAVFVWVFHSFLKLSIFATARGSICSRKMTCDQRLKRKAEKQLLHSGDSYQRWCFIDSCLYALIRYGTWSKWRVVFYRRLGLFMMNDW